jgi:hypothetical protein
MQAAIVILIVGGAIVFVARTLYKNAKGHACESGACGCAKPITKKQRIG